jgi:hypothetical protein
MPLTRNSAGAFGRASGGDHHWAVGLTVALAASTGLFLARSTLTFPGHIPAVVGLAAVLIVAAGALVLPTQTVVLGFALLAFVRVEPAPVDLVFAFLIIRTIVFDRTVVRVPPLVLLATAGFAAWTVFSTSDAADLAAALRFVFITLYLLVLTVWLTGIFDRRELTRSCIKSYIYAAAVSAAIGILALRVGFPGSSSLAYGGARAKAFFKDPNVFSPFLVPAAVIVIEDLARPRLFGPRRRLPLVGLLLILVGGSIFAFSRAGWLNLGTATIVLLAVLATRRDGARAVSRILGALAFAACGAYLALRATGTAHFFETRTHLEAYDQTRFATQHTAFEQMWTHLFGYGPGQSEIALAHSTHSLFARVFFEQGFVGGALLIVVLLGTTAAAIGSALRDRDVHGIGSAALLAAWTGLLVNSIFVDTLHWRHLWVIAALVWYGAASRGDGGVESDGRQTGQRETRPRTIATALR